MASKKIYPSLRVRGERGKWFKLFLALLPVSLLLFPFIVYHTLWVKLPWLSLDALIVNKTVPQESYSEHSSLVWILNHYKAGKGKALLSSKDFLGYHPDKKKCESIILGNVANRDVIYIVDTYGTYRYKMGFKEYEANLPRRNLDVPLICGGIERKEAETLLADAKKSSIIIGEFNIFGFPTSLDPEALKILEEVFQVKWTGWFGRHYDNFFSCPKWVKNLYEAVYGEDWNFSGPGTVMVKKSDMVGIAPDVLVFKDPPSERRPFAVFAKDHHLTEGVDSPLMYNGWFEVVKPEKGTQTIAYFHIAETVSNLKELGERGLKPLFPAIVLSKSTGTKIYFAGDFADNKFFGVPYNIFGIENWMKTLSRANKTDSFFWRFYVPLMRNVLYWQQF